MLRSAAQYGTMILVTDEKTTDWRTHAPCLDLPGFERVDGDELWPDTIAAANAKAICRSCPFTIECAVDALSAGTPMDSIAPTPADDTIRAGIVCTGDDKTRRALQAAIEGRAYRQRAKRPTHCTQCAVEMCGTKTSSDPKIVPHAGRGICARCKQRNHYQTKKETTAA